MIGDDVVPFSELSPEQQNKDLQIVKTCQVVRAIYDDIIEMYTHTHTAEPDLCSYTHTARSYLGCMYRFEELDEDGNGVLDRHVCMCV